MEKIKEVQLDNESKRRFISTQKMSGEEARARRIERDNVSCLKLILSGKLTLY